MESLFPQPCGAPELKPCWPSILNALVILLPDASPSDCLGGLFYVRTSCVACVGLILFGASVVFIIDVCHLSPQCMLAIIPFIGGVTDVVRTRACTGY